ncbi:MAG: hypothetical protein ABMA02_07935 [Saprospiraceae bacterium]
MASALPSSTKESRTATDEQAIVPFPGFRDKNAATAPSERQYW